MHIFAYYAAGQPDQSRYFFIQFLLIFYVDLYGLGEVNDTKTGGILRFVNPKWDWSDPFYCWFGWGFVNS